MSKKLYLLPLLLLVISCTKIDYIGQEYPPTTQVDMFFAPSDVEQDYTVMGTLVATAADIVSSEKMQKDIIKKAKEKGADAVIFEDLDRYQSGTTSSYTETTKHEKDKKGKDKTVTTGTQSSSTEEKKQIKATFIKYK
ncbi:conserved hypothetical protein [Candidatus Zixiibacteriota bacterium]|nr:conserved hypothetical protein [candidate division Zixibacteria bacterium]